MKEQIENLSMKQIENRVFKWNSRKADETYFRSCLWQFAQGRVNQDFRPFLDSIVWKVNDGGKTIKYMHFNDRAQRVYLDWYFIEWAKRVIDEYEEILKSRKGLSFTRL